MTCAGSSTARAGRARARPAGFDGQQFTPREENPTSHSGPHFYAAQVFSDAPGGRVIMIGWLAGPHYPGMPFSQGMSVPLELSLRGTPQGARLCFYPVRELEALRAATVSARDLSLEQANRLLGEAGELLDVELTLRPQGPLALDVRGRPLAYDPAAGELSFEGSRASLPPAPGPLRLRVLVDRSVTEVFAQDGLAAFAAVTVFEDPSRPLRLEGRAEVEEIKIHALRSMWP